MYKNRWIFGFIHLLIFICVFTFNGKTQQSNALTGASNQVPATSVENKSGIVKQINPDSALLLYRQFIYVYDSVYAQKKGVDPSKNKILKEAVVILNEGLASAKTNGNSKAEQDISLALAVVYEKTGNYQDALKFSKRYFLFRDSINRNEEQQKLQALHTTFEEQNKAQEVLLLEKNKQFLEVEAKNQQVLKNIFIGGLVLLVMIVLLLFNRYRISQKAARNLEEKNTIIREEREKAAHSEKFKEHFLANMSHEIRTPMNAIIGLSNLLAGKIQDEQSTRYLKAIQHSSENLLVIINDILDLSKMEAGKAVLENKIFNLHRTMEMVKESFEPLAHEKNIELFLETGVPPNTYIIGDEARLIQVLNNLVGNAIKFTDKGFVRITTKVKEKKAGSLEIEFAVEDTGIGIPPDKHHLIFENFEQAHTSEPRQQSGTGLGLAISSRLVELQGGKIKMVSEPGDGSVFSFDLSFEEANEIDFKTQHDANGKKLQDHIYEGELRILLVEDNEFNQIVAVDTLKKYFPGLEFRIAGNGKDAISLLDQEPFDMIFMDIRMPVMDGFEATKQIRMAANRPYVKIPIVALTASVIRSDFKKCLDAGMDGYLSKPFMEYELVEAVLKFSGRNFITGIRPDETGPMVNDEEKYRELFLKLVPQRLLTIEEAVKKGDWRTIRDTVHLMRPQLCASGMTDQDELFMEFENMDGKVPFMTWHKKSNLFCSLVREKLSETEKI